MLYRCSTGADGYVLGSEYVGGIVGGANEGANRLLLQDGTARVTANAACAIGNAYIASQFDAVLAQVRSGVSLSAALESVDGFQRKLCSSIAVGEETGQLDSMLDSIADSMEYDAQQASRRMMTILEPMLIVLMAFVVGFIIIAVMSPIIGSYSAIEFGERITSETCKPHKGEK